MTRVVYAAMKHELRNREYFERIGAGNDRAIDLFTTAVLIAQEADPQVSVEEQRGVLGGIVDHLKPLMVGSVLDRYQALGQEFFGPLAFAGNRDDYYNPDNSYLPKVLESRKGIPITLALILIEVARSLGLAAAGVGFPGHFLVRDEEVEEIILDPFTGKCIAELDLAARLGEPEGGGGTADGTPVRSDQLKGLLKKSSNRATILRLVSNLKHAYMLKSEFESALRTCEIALLLDPAHAASYRDRGLVYEKLELFNRAERDLTTYLELSPGDGYASAVAEHLVDLRNRVSLFH